MPTFGRIEAQITIPSGGWTGTINDSGAGGAVAWSVAAGTYYLSTLITAFAAALNVAATTDTLTVTWGSGENGTGKVTITSTGTCTIVFTSTDLQELLGYSGATLGPGTSFVATNRARSVWHGDCPYEAPNAIYPWEGVIEVNARSVESDGGDVYGLVGQYKFSTNLRWSGVKRSRASQANESTTNESFERFLRDGVWGLASWGTPTGPIKFYPDADASDAVTYAVVMPTEFRPDLFFDGWAGGPWRCGFERLVAQ